MNGLPTFDRFTRSVMAAVLGALAAVGAAAAPRQAEPAFLVRDRSLELPTRYVPPPGNPLEHHAAGFAQSVFGCIHHRFGCGLCSRERRVLYGTLRTGGPLQASIIRRRCRARPFEPYPGCCSTADRTQTAALSMCGARPGWMVIADVPRLAEEDTRSLPLGINLGRLAGPLMAGAASKAATWTARYPVKTPCAWL